MDHKFLGGPRLPYFPRAGQHCLLLCAQGASLQKLSHGDVSEVIANALSKAVSISAPVFFSNGGGPQSTLQDTSEPILVFFQSAGSA